MAGGLVKDDTETYTVPFTSMWSITVPPGNTLQLEIGKTYPMDEIAALVKAELEEEE